MLVSQSASQPASQPAIPVSIPFQQPNTTQPRRAGKTYRAQVSRAWGSSEIVGCWSTTTATTVTRRMRTKRTAAELQTATHQSCNRTANCNTDGIRKKERTANVEQQHCNNNTATPLQQHCNNKHCNPATTLQPCNNTATLQQPCNNTATHATSTETKPNQTKPNQPTNQPTNQCA